MSAGRRQRPRARVGARRAALPRTGSPDRRIRLLLLATAVVFAAVLGRAVQLQAFGHERLAAKAASQHRQSVSLPAKRGAIRDRDGRPLALTQEAVTIGARVADVQDAEAVARAVAGATGEDASKLLGRLTRRTVLHVDLARQVDPAVARRLEALALPGVTFTPEERRFYPSGVAAQLIGITDIDSRGLAGLERQYDRVLRGRDGREVYVRDPQGDAISIVSSEPATQGADLTLTLDRDLQAAAEHEVTEAVRRTRADGAVALALDPRTGGVLAMASAPGPGPRGFRAASQNEQRIRAITDQYEPGSTFKVVTVAAGLTEGVITAATPIEVPYCMQRYDRKLCDHHPHATETMSVARILSESSNVGTVKIADDFLSGTGEDDHGQYFAPYVERLGFGKATGIDLPGEIAGTVLPYREWRGTSVINIPIGQGIAATPIQLASLYGMLANGGVWNRPHLVGRIGRREGVRTGTRRMLRPTVARDINRMLEGVVSERGTGKLAAVPGYTVAGKTGTTQKLERDGTYSTSRHIAFFVGFAPARRPRVVTLVMVDEPKGGDDYGGTIAAPIFSRLTAKALRELRVRQDRPVARDRPR